MDIYSIYNKLDTYQNKLTENKLRLQDIKRTNSEVVELREKLTKAKHAEKILAGYVQLINKYYKLTAKEETDYKNRRLDFLSSYIDSNLDAIFPNEGFKSKVICDFTYNSSKARLLLKDSAGNVRIPSMTEGKLCQELISFSSAIAIVESLNENKFYMDEAFAASSPENLTKISILIEKAIMEGMQIILIEQKDDIYKDLPRREFHLYKDELEACVKLQKVVDF